MLDVEGFDVSYSGLKTAVINHVRRAEGRGERISIEDVAASFQQAVVDIQVGKTIAAAEHVAATEGVPLWRGGGELSSPPGLADACAERGLSLYVPPLERSVPTTPPWWPPVAPPCFAGAFTRSGDVTGPEPPPGALGGWPQALPLSWDRPGPV